MGSLGLKPVFLFETRAKEPDCAADSVTLYKKKMVSGHALQTFPEDFSQWKVSEKVSQPVIFIITITFSSKPMYICLALYLLSGSTDRMT